MIKRTTSNGAQWADLFKFLLADPGDAYSLAELEEATGIPDTTLARKLPHLVSLGLLQACRYGHRKQWVFFRAGHLARGHAA